jgi:pimeloyl-ACP methyl ester carboxylesterase
MGSGSGGKCGWVRASATAIIGLVLLLAPAATGAQAATIRSRDPGIRRIPVILVAGLDGEVGRTWGHAPGAGGRGSGLIAELVDRDYRPGRDVFPFDYSSIEDEDFVRLAARELARKVEWVIQRTGEPEVDLVGYGYGGLICRYYLRLPGANDRVRTLVLIATPARGAFSAHHVRVAAEQARQELWPTHPRGPASGETLPHFRDAITYVAQRAVVYGGLYHEFLGEGEVLAGPTAGGQGRQRAGSFSAWFATRRPDLYRAWFLEAQSPPLTPPGCLLTPPREGEALTRAYYEFLALETGRHHYLRAVTRRTVTLRPPPESILTSPDPVAGVLEYLRAAAADYLYQRGRAYLEQNRTSLAFQVLSRILPLPTAGVANERLIPEWLSFSAGWDPAGRPIEHRLTANHLLRQWNQTESLPPNGVRQVIVAGRTLNLAGAIWQGVTDNDLVIEVESTLVPLGRDDLLTIIPGLWRGTHLALLHDSRLHQAVADALTLPYQVSHWQALPERPAGWSRRIRSRANAWRPTYLQVDGGDHAGGRLAVTVRADAHWEAASRGLEWQLWAHAVAADGLVEATWSAAFEREGPVPEARLDLPAPGPHRLLVGVRLIPRAAPGEDQALTGGEGDGASPARDRRSATLLGAGGRPFPFTYEVTWKPDPAPSPAGAALSGPSVADPSGETDLPSPPSAGADSPLPGPVSPNPRDQGAAAPSPAASAAAPVAPSLPPGSGAGPTANSSLPPLPPGPSGPLPPPVGAQGLPEVSGQTNLPPLVEVQTVRRLITTRKESRTYHVRWEWELGDGRRVVDPTAGLLVSRLTPAYPTPGNYVVRAFSFSNQGQILREQRWTVSIPAGVGPDRPGHGPTLQAETLGEPRVVLALAGPAAWVVGRPARFVVRAWAEDPPYGKIEEVEADPGWAFDVVWTRPGTYAVAAAVTVRVRYALGGRRFTLANTYLQGVKVDVAATSVSR